MIFSAAILTWGVVRAIRTAWKFRFGFSAECRTVEAMLHQFEELRRDENSARALLMQLRVYQMQNEEGRSGFAVTAFVPNDVLAHAKKFPQYKNTLVRTVAIVLVRRALDGLWNMGHENKVTALVFEPIGDSAQCSTWGDGPRPIHIASMVDDDKAKLARKAIADARSIPLGDSPVKQTVIAR